MLRTLPNCLDYEPGATVTIPQKISSLGAGKLTKNLPAVRREELSFEKPWPSPEMARRDSNDPCRKSRLGSMEAKLLTGPQVYHTCHGRL